MSTKRMEQKTVPSTIVPPLAPARTDAAASGRAVAPPAACFVHGRNDGEERGVGRPERVRHKVEHGHLHDTRVKPCYTCTPAGTRTHPVVLRARDDHRQAGGGAPVGLRDHRHARAADAHVVAVSSAVGGHVAVHADGRGGTGREDGVKAARAAWVGSEDCIAAHTHCDRPHASEW